MPDRIAVDANGYGWRVWDDQEHWSMVPTNPDNSPIPQPVTWFVQLRKAGRQTMTDLTARMETGALLLAVIRNSVTSASSDGRTVEHPEQAAQYVINALTVHQPKLLASAAYVFAHDETEALFGVEAAGEREATT
jgi:hypothetical protein